jgi:phage tail-like protein
MSVLVRPYDFLRDAAAGWRVADADRTAQNGVLLLGTLRSARPPVDDEHGSFGDSTLPRGVAVKDDELFAIDRDRSRVLHWRPCCGPARPLPGLGGPVRGVRSLSDPRGLAVSDAGDLLVADTGNRRVLVLTLPGLALRRVICPDADWEPVDLAAAGGRWIHVADAGGRIWRLDAAGRPSRYYGGRLAAGARPWRLAVDARGRTFVLLERVRVPVVLDRRGAPFAPADSPAAGGALGGSPLTVVDSRVRFQPPPSDGCPRAAIDTGLVVDDRGSLLLGRSHGGVPEWGPFLAWPPRRESYQAEGRALLEPLDSGRLGNAWHRVALELSAPERTAVRVLGLTSDLPRPDLRAAAVPADGDGEWHAAPRNADDWLVQCPPGRFLHLALVLEGTGAATPEVSRLYVYRTRDSSLRHLPATYHADETSRHLLDRLLSMLDSVHGEVETQIEGFAQTLDPRGAPEAFLPWLASWFGLELERTWSESQRRAFIASALELYRWRGTVRGLRLLLRLHTGLEGPLPAIVEHRRGTNDPALADWLGDEPGEDPFPRFSVLVPAPMLDGEDDRRALERLIEAAKPAHTVFRLRGVGPGARLGGDYHCGSALGLDALLTSHTAWRLPPEAGSERVLGGRTMLADERVPGGALGQLTRSRLGVPGALRPVPEELPPIPTRRLNHERD